MFILFLAMIQLCVSTNLRFREVTLENYHEIQLELPICVIFYKGTNKESARMQKEMNSALKELENEQNLVMGILDLSKEKIIAEDLGMNDKTNKIFLFSDGKNETYQGQLYGLNIADWIKRKLRKYKPNYKILTGIEEKEKIFNGSLSVVAYIGDKEGKKFKMFEDLARLFKDLEFVYISEKSLIQNMIGSEVPNDNRPLLMIYNLKENNPQFYYKDQGEDWELKYVKKFISVFSVPNMLFLDIEMLEKFRKAKEPVFFLIYKKENAEEELALFRFVREIITPDIFIGYMDNESNEGSKLMEILLLKPNDLPSIWIFDQSKKPIFKYRYTGNFDLQEISDFYNQFKKNKLVPVWKSDSPPIQKWDLYIVVGTTFKEVVFNPRLDVIMLYTSYDCDICRKLEKDFDNLAGKYKQYPYLKFGLMDILRNEIEFVVFESVPKVVFYSKKDKTPFNLNTIDIRKIEAFIRGNIQGIKDYEKSAEL